ncbi:hypothetical protein OS493_026007 [Desmophyllum pertusum]|uniref:Acetylserotonin O-methyltransferase n=1 Tax=Desmophyllum pertusum TaxID=174260 RepID=A0A9W9YPD3_9CNID|nr:hypothetical protein OS493_026007 [Desmophyllum pertusum]
MGSRVRAFPRLIRTIFTTTARVVAGRKEIVAPPPIPGKLHDLIFAFRQSKVLFAACDLGVFDVLHESDAPQSAEDISSKLTTNVDATTRFMDALVALELLEKTKQGKSWLYSNTEMAKQFLTKSSPDSVDGYIRHSNQLLYPLFGGTGSMAYTLCQYYPNMKITVCDLQSVVDSAYHFRPSLEDCPNQGNVSHVVGNFFQPDLPKADLYVMSRILHDWTKEKVDLILSNVFKCLPSGGCLLIAERFLNKDKTGPKSHLLQCSICLCRWRERNEQQQNTSSF